MVLQDVEVAADVDFGAVADLCEGFSGDDITNICRDAAMNGMRILIAGKTPDQIRCRTVLAYNMACFVQARIVCTCQHYFLFALCAPCACEIPS